MIPGLTLQAFQLRSQQVHALHPVEAALQYHRAQAEIPGEEGHGGCGFEEAEAHYRAGAQGLRLSEIPQLPQQLRELSRLGPVDRAGRKALRSWAESSGHVINEDRFLKHWIAQGKRGGAEHQVYYDPESGRCSSASTPRRQTTLLLTASTDLSQPLHFRFSISAFQLLPPIRFPSGG
jgi:hypothetical protein